MIFGQVLDRLSRRVYVGPMANNVKVSLPATNNLVVSSTGLGDLLSDLSELGISGVLVTELSVDDNGHAFVVQLGGAQLAQLINQHAYGLLADKYESR